MNADKTKLCIFDLDGTLTNTLETIAHFANTALEKFGYNSIEPNIYKTFIGNGSRELIAQAVSFVNASEPNFEAVHTHYKCIYNADFLYKTTVYDGIFELINSLKKLKIKLAILSNKPHDTTVAVAEAMFGKNIFDIIIGGGNGPLKPAPDSLFEILAKANTMKSECIYIGDSTVDMQTGKNAGVFTVGVLWGFEERSKLAKQEPNAMIEQPTELLKFLNK